MIKIALHGYDNSAKVSRVRKKSPVKLGVDIRDWMMRGHVMMENEQLSTVRLGLKLRTRLDGMERDLLGLREILKCSYTRRDNKEVRKETKR